MASRNYVFQSDFAKRHQAKGRQEGRVQALLTVLDARGVALTEDDCARIRSCSDEAQLDTWIRRAVTAASVSDLFR